MKLTWTQLFFLLAGLFVGSFVTAYGAGFDQGPEDTRLYRILASLMLTWGSWVIVWKAACHVAIGRCKD